jgi:hypothetical protein
MTTPTLAIVTATSSVERAIPCMESWIKTATDPPPIFLIHNGGERIEGVSVTGTQVAWASHPEYLGSVRAFERGVAAALAGPFEIIACLHDDFEILEPGWDAMVRRCFAQQPNMGLAGFGGAIGLGAHDMYQKDYDPMSLARVGFRSNLVDAEVHGVRSLLRERVACLDGFSQVGRRDFWRGIWSPAKIAAERTSRHTTQAERAVARPVWQNLAELGIVHHLYDSLLGALAARHGWETWYLPLRAQHHGGRTAVGDPAYQDWAKGQIQGGDHGFWLQAHATGYEAFRDVLPLRV